MIRVFLVIVWIMALPVLANAQVKDTLIIKKDSVAAKDTVAKKLKTSLKEDTLKRKHSPRKAAIMSAIMPGLGQIYNKKYWKVPIVYAAVGIPAGLFIYNKNWYDRTRYALAVVVNKSYNNPDSLARVHSRLRPLVDLKAEGSLLNYRNEFRKNMDYSILFGLLFWGLNIVDATVDAHLKDFDISEDLSLRIKPAILSGGNAAGVSFVFTIGGNQSKIIPSLR